MLDFEHSEANGSRMAARDDDVDEMALSGNKRKIRNLRLLSSL
ncbi:MAG: hypothetical protein QF473_05340 [Planctomycetota bacterium]|jgi:hypothetical protein|nr:hypothetical protein [Planctomycetota bacterium]MDP6506471.1 hypothetical protein [Planctomycetota bacterium]